MNQSLLNCCRGMLLGATISQEIINQKETVLNWQVINQKIIIDLINKETISSETCQAIASEDEQISSGEFILGILPLIFFFHETEYLFSEQLEKIERYMDINSQVIEEAMLFRRIIDLTFKGQDNLLKNIFNFSPPLEQIQTFLENHTSLTQLKKKFKQNNNLDQHYLRLSLYCFYRTPNNFKLSILQASQFNNPLILGITASLSGAYNGYNDIPIPWRFMITQKKDYERLYQQISQLWAKWAGVAQPLKMIIPLENQTINSVNMNNR
ncbi:MAG: ADP-ribosylglycohydrolase family protein [Crocosphaera sp.]|nr:ADP-ribosylglycohydrolase family protein [Crocosphaera sp.]